MTSKGPGTTPRRRSSRSSPDNYQANPLQTALLQFPRSRQVPLALHLPQGSIQDHVRVRRQALQHRARAYSPTTGERHRHHRNGLSYARGSISRRTYQRATIPRQSQNHLSNSARERAAINQFFILGVGKKSGLYKPSYPAPILKHHHTKER